MIRFHTAMFSLFALLLAPAVSYAQSESTDIETDGTAAESHPELRDSDRRLSNQELRTHIYSLEQVAKRQELQIEQLLQSLAGSQNELNRLSTDYQQYANDMAKTLSTMRDQRLENDEVFRDQLAELSRKLASENSGRLASDDALMNEVSLVAEKVTAGEQELSSIAQQTTDNSSSLDSLDNRVTLSEESLSEQGELLNSKFIDVTDALSSQTLIGGTTAALFGLIVFFLGRKMVVNRQQLIGQISESSESLRTEYGDLDLKISALLEQQLERLSPNDDGGSADVEPDHSLPLQVAAEIHRMSKRLDNMPPGTKGVQPLEKALERLVDGLATNGYEIVSLLGMKYDEGMTIQASFTLDDDLPPGDQVISRVIKPQVNYKGAVVQVADVEVSFGE